MSERMSAQFRLREVLILLVAAVAIFLIVTLLTYSAADPGWQGSSHHILNAGGRIGAWCAYSLLALFGGFGFLVPFVMLYGVIVRYVNRHKAVQKAKGDKAGKADQPSKRHARAMLCLHTIGVLLVFLSGSALASIGFHTLGNVLPYGPGGLLGNLITVDLLPWLNYGGSLIALIAAFLIGLTLFSGVSWVRFLWLLLKGFIYALMTTARSTSRVAQSRREARQAARERKRQAKQLAAAAAPMPTVEMPIVDEEPLELPVEIAETVVPELVVEQPTIMKKPIPVVEANPARSVVPDTEKRASVRPAQSFSAGDIPSIDLLTEPKPSNSKPSQDQLDQTAALVEQRLQDFGIKVSVVGVCPGPIVTRYELELSPGLKVSKLSGLSKDLARSLAVHSVRIVEVIPGKSVVGLEIPNADRETVYLKEVLDTKAFHDMHSPLAMGLGKDISGHPEVVNLGKMPHLLVAGTTGSGKSVGVNAMILSMLFKARPEDLRMIMIDPKMLELSIYEGIPHLLTPVVTDMKEAASALRWCVREMDRRYKVMAGVGVRNIAGLNDKIRESRKAGTPLSNEAGELEPMPYIVVVVDEFADMMMVVGKKVEELIARLAQKARAAGIHLILATQRPSVDVITGLIKANIPCRISFQVSSKIDSRTILDQMGAEQLLGYGDMLYLPAGTSVPIRVHGAFVSDEEVHAVASAWKALGEPEYIDSILSTDQDADATQESEAGGEKDELYDQAVQIVMETQRASISNVQRRLRIGYNRAARLLEDMEAAGIVSEVQSNGMREILTPQ